MVTPNPLDQMFPCKFRRLESAAEVAAVVGRLVGGPGPAIANPVTTPANLHQPHGAGLPAQEGVVTGVVAQNPAPSAPVAAPTPTTPEGKDMTSKFPVAEEQDFKVYRNGGLYFVYDADDLSAPVNEKGVAKAKVAEVIKTALEK